MPGTKKRSAAKSTRRKVKQVIGSRVKITLDESVGSERLTLETPTGQTITLNGARGTVEMLDGNGNSIKLDPAGLTIRAAGKVTVQAAEIRVSATNLVVDAAMSKFNGVVQCDTLISTSVVSSSYTPGAGNIL